MTIEVEAKIRVDDVEALRRRLAAAGTVLAPPVTQQDTLFRSSRPEGLGRDETLRLRRVQDGFELTFKGARQPGRLKARREESVPLGADPTALLAQLGFSPAASVRKERETGSLGAVQVALDHVEGLGWFVELEVLARPDRVADAETTIDAAAARLGLGDAPRLRQAYVEMLNGAVRPDRPDRPERPD